MRPLRLSIEGFTCFKERQEVDFRALDLFAISGPTGAGKSSLLDAMIFALYGLVPRVGKGYSELISLGRDRMSVCFDFRVGGREFRVTRIGRHTRPEAQLEELTGGAERPIANGMRSVDQRIEELLGLGYEAFTQSVVLPQGDFAKFLKSQPRERRIILRDLLRLHLYERMRERAAARHKELELAVQGLKERLEREYEGVTPEALEALQAEQAALAEALKASEAALQERQAALDGLRRRHEKTQELKARRERAVRLDAEEPRIRDLEAKLSAARRAAPVLPLVEAVAEAEAVARAARAHKADAADTHAKARAARERAAERLEKAEQEAAQIPKLRERIRQLDEVKGQLEARAAASARLEKARAQRDKLQAELSGARGAEQKANSLLPALEQAAKKAAAAVEAAGYDAALDEALNGVRDLATGLGPQREAACEAAEEAREAAKRLEVRTAAEARARAEAEAAREKQEKARKKRDELDASLREAQRREAAALLRRELHAGEPCPVCDQSVPKRPRAQPAPKVDELQEKLARADEDSRRAEEAAEKKAADASGAQAALEESRQAEAAARKKAEAAARQLAKAERALQERVGGAFTGEKGEPIEALVAEAVKLLRERKKQWEQAGKAREKADKELEKATREAERAAEKAAELGSRVQEQLARVEETEGELAKLDAQIAKVTKHPDPAAEREELARSYDALEEGRKAAREEERESVKAEAAASTLAATATQRAEEAERLAEKARERARIAARDAGFADEQEVQRAALQATAQATLEGEINAWRNERQAVAQRAAELTTELAGREVDGAEVQAAAEEVARRRQEREQGLKRQAALQEQIQQLSHRLELARQLHKDLDARSRELSTYGQLADELRSDAFQAYLLQETMRELVAGASERLMKLSGRYTLEYTDEAFHVLDHDNARERRSADTLSGGETFLTSLALALELSEQVQRAAGGVVLDSLFIDEGFGTLDPETLETAAEAIESLPAGGRLVGIITHIPELTQRLPARLVVTKRAEGSQVRAEAG